MKDIRLRQKALKKLYEMAFGPSRDAFRLLYLSEEDVSALEGLDLRQVASLHRAANGGVEIKLVDKARLIAMLLEATAGDEPESTGEVRDGRESFVEALDRAARRISGSGDEDGE